MFHNLGCLPRPLKAIIPHTDTLVTRNVVLSTSWEWSGSRRLASSPQSWWWRRRGGGWWSWPGWWQWREGTRRWDPQWNSPAAKQIARVSPISYPSKIYICRYIYIYIKNKNKRPQITTLPLCYPSVLSVKRWWLHKCCKSTQPAHQGQKGWGWGGWDRCGTSLCGSDVQFSAWSALPPNLSADARGNTACKYTM